MEETKLTAALPNLDIEIVHREDPERGAEIIAMQIRATPSFDALRGLLAPSLPAAFRQSAFLPAAFLPAAFLPAAFPAMLPNAVPSKTMLPMTLLPMTLLPMTLPMQLWADLVRQAWAPWLRLPPAPDAAPETGDKSGR